MSDRSHMYYSSSAFAAEGFGSGYISAETYDNSAVPDGMPTSAGYETYQDNDYLEADGTYDDEMFRHYGQSGGPVRSSSMPSLGTIQEEKKSLGDTPDLAHGVSDDLGSKLSQLNLNTSPTPNPSGTHGPVKSAHGLFRSPDFGYSQPVQGGGDRVGKIGTLKPQTVPESASNFGDRNDNLGSSYPSYSAPQPGYETTTPWPYSNAPSYGSYGYGTAIATNATNGNYTEAKASPVASYAQVPVSQPNQAIPTYGYYLANQTMPNHGNSQTALPGSTYSTRQPSPVMDTYGQSQVNQSIAAYGQNPVNPPMSTYGHSLVNPPMSTPVSTPVSTYGYGQVNRPAGTYSQPGYFSYGQPIPMSMVPAQTGNYVTPMTTTNGQVGSIYHTTPATGHYYPPATPYGLVPYLPLANTMARTVTTSTTAAAAAAATTTAAATGTSQIAVRSNAGPRNVVSRGGVFHVTPMAPFPADSVPIFAKRTEIGTPIMPRYKIEPTDKLGVIKISQTGFGVRINEVIILFGRNAILHEYPAHSANYAVHIVQDRLTGKTLDTYVEFPDYEMADSVIKRFQKRAMHNRDTKIGTRHVRMDLTTSSKLMAEMFPRARCSWVNGRPSRDKAYLEAHPMPWTGFISNEEMITCVNLANGPSTFRARFTKDNPERVYNSMMSTLAKMPWDEPENPWFPEAWVAQLKNTLFQMSTRLAIMVRNRVHLHLDVKLLNQFMTTLRACPLFSADETKYAGYMHIADEVDAIIHDPGRLSSAARRLRERQNSKEDNGVGAATATAEDGASITA